MQITRHPLPQYFRWSKQSPRLSLGDLQPPASLWSSIHLSIPLEFQPPEVPVPVVTARINGSGPFHFVFDTGWTGVPAYVEPWVFETLKLKYVGGRPRLSGIGPTFSPLEGVALSLLGKAGVEKPINHIPVFTADREIVGSIRVRNIRIAGILGLHLLDKFVAQLDFRSRELRLCEPQVFRTPSGPNVLMPKFVQTAGGPFEVQIRLPGQRDCNYYMDTGASRCSASPSLLEGIPARPLGRIQVLDIRGKIELESVVIPEIFIGPTVIRDVIHTVDPKEPTPLLGSSVLSQFLMTIDQPGRSLFLEPYPLEEKKISW